ncbi:MAG TPA: hypothetical protein VHK27_05470 [Gammaproteobacteria bacterium]|nr:hypothetical protein [Gammaproteobacteria bacterium]
MTEGIDATFCRILLNRLRDDFKEAGVKLDGKPVNLRDKRFWVYSYSDGTWEFHGPNEFYWSGRADNAYDARYKGWRAWAAMYSPEWQKFEAEAEAEAKAESVN